MAVSLNRGHDEYPSPAADGGRNAGFFIVYSHSARPLLSGALCPRVQYYDGQLRKRPAGRRSCSKTEALLRREIKRCPSPILFAQLSSWEARRLEPSTYLSTS